MEENKSTLRLIAEHLVRAIAPLRDAVTDLESLQAFMLRIGWQVDSLPPEYSALTAAVNDALNALNNLGDGAEAGEALDLIKTVGDVYRRMKEITTSPDGISPVDADDFIEELAGAVFELLLVEYLAATFPAAYNALLAVGIIEFENIDPTPTRPGFLAIRFRSDEIPKVITEPQKLPERIYGWGTADVNFKKLAGHLHELFVALGLEAYVQTVDNEFGSAFQDQIADTDEPVELMLNIPLLFDNINGEEVELGLGLLELPAEGTKPAGVVLLPLVPSSVGTNIEISPNVKLVLRAESDLAEQLGIMFRGDDIEVRFPFAEGTTSPSAGFGANLVFTPPEPVALFGEPERTRLQLNGASFGLTLNALQQVEFLVHLNIDGLTLIVAADMFDGFLTRLFGSEDLKVAIPLTLVWSSLTGVNFTGGAGLTISIVPHLKIGPVEIERFEATITSTVSSSAPPDFKVAFAVSVAGELGPLTFVTQGVGISLALIFEEGNAGPFDVKTGFKAPSGIGIVVDEEIIKGGGFLASDSTGDYFGALELTIKEMVSVKALGVVGTKMPDGSRGFSFAAIITVSDFPAINLGFGFRLTGVGGIIGMDRTFDFAKLEEKLKRGVLRNLLFPPNPVANATAILADMTQVFPAARDHYVFGLMFRITWGSEKLVVIDLAVIIAETVAVLGIVDVYFPRFDFAQVEVHVHIIGELDLGRKRIFVHAEILNTSHIFGFKLSGGAAMLVAWGEQPVFILSFGGFNKRYEQQLPPGFPALDRLTVQLVDTKNLKATLRVYLAVTSNSVQIGGSFALKAGVGKFTIEGALTVDALFQFYAKPRFIFDLDAWLELKAWGVTLFSVRVQGTLSGGSPWHARGKATFKIWIFSCSVHFDEVWGDDAAEESLPVADVRSLVIEAFKDSRNWTAELPPETQGLVTLREPISDIAMLHPLSALAIAQRVAPLNVSLTRFGNAKPQGQNFFTIEKVLVGSSNILEGATSFTVGTVREHFARSQFLDMTDDEKLESPAFEKMDCGVRLGTAPVRHAAPLTAPMSYQTLKYNGKTKQFEEVGETIISDTVLTQLVGTGAAASAPSAVRLSVRPPAVKIAPIKYVVMTVENQNPVTEDRSTYTQAEELMRAKVAAKTHDKTELQVLEVTR
jgi:hypothetical protein